MNVLLIGGASQIMDAMVDVVNKNGHKSYLLMEGGKKSSAYKHAFEKYNFPYEDESVKDIIKSIKPEVVLFMGAQDTAFDWEGKGSRELARYTGAVTNILSVYASVAKGRFIYLSSDEIYGDSYVSNIPEEMMPAPKGYKAMAIMQGEGICESYRKLQGIETIVLRLDHLYGLPQKGQKEGDVCFRMCREALRTGTISADSRNIFSMLHVKDAAAFIYSVMNAKEHNETCYHMSSMKELNELELANIIREEAGFHVEILEHAADESRRCILNGDKFIGEYGICAITGYQKEIGEIIQYMRRYKDSFVSSQEADRGAAKKDSKNMNTVIKSLIPFAENLICCVFFYFLNSQAAGSRYLGRLDFLLLYVLLFAIVHGQQQAILSALLAVFGYFLQQTSGRSGFEVLLDYNTYVWTAQLFIVGMAVGFTRDRMYHIREEQEEEIRFLQRRVKNIEEINDSNVRMKQGFETELVNQRDSLGRIYEVTSRLERYEPEEILFYAAEILEELMDTRDVAIYLVANKGYARLFSSTSAQARQLGSSFAYASSGELYETLKDHRVYINHTMDKSLPMMASAVFSQDEMQFIFMVWGLPWQRMNLAEANRLTITGALIQNSVVRARRYLEALKEQRYLEGTNTMNKEAFTPLVNAFLDARNRGLTECVLLEILTGKENYKQADRVLGENMRQTDYLGILEDGSLYVLLANTDEEKSEGVAERFHAAGYKTRLRKVW